MAKKWSKSQMVPSPLWQVTTSNLWSEINWPLTTSGSAIFQVKLIYSEKATKFCEISILLLTGHYIGQILWPSQNIWTLLFLFKWQPRKVIPTGVSGVFLPKKVIKTDLDCNPLTIGLPYAYTFCLKKRQV